MENRGTILLAEDNPNDVFLVQRALQELGIANPLAVARDGLEALQYLTGEGQYSDRERFPLPMLVLLDLDMPLMTGFDVLGCLRRAPEFKDVPVVVFTGSSLSPDVARAYRLGANSFLVKPADIEQLKGSLKETIQFGVPGSLELNCTVRKRITTFRTVPSDLRVGMGNGAGAARRIQSSPLDICSPRVTSLRRSACRFRRRDIVSLSAWTRPTAQSGYCPSLFGLY